MSREPDGSGASDRVLRVTVAICTHDRAGLLDRTLASLEQLRVPDDVEWQVLVVANACTDATPEVLRRHRDALPLRHVREERRGHSHARNRAVREADGDLLIWTDDDVRVSPGWIGAYAEALRRWPDASFFGGPIRPDFEGRPPEWLRRTFDASEAVRAAYAERDLGPEPLAIRDADHLPYGANMALPLEVQRRHTYDPRLGRSGTDLVGGDELAVLRSVLEEGGTGRWVPDAPLDHFIPAERQTFAYLRRYFRDQGRVAKPLPEDEPVPTLFGKPRWAFRAVLEEEVRYRAGRLLSPPESWIEHLIDASFARGVLMGPPEASNRRG